MGLGVERERGCGPWKFQVVEINRKFRIESYEYNWFLIEPFVGNWRKSGQQGTCPESLLQWISQEVPAFKRRLPRNGREKNAGTRWWIDGWINIQTQDIQPLDLISLKITVKWYTLLLFMFGVKKSWANMLLPWKSVLVRMEIKPYVEVSVLWHKGVAKGKDGPS